MRATIGGEKAYFMFNASVAREGGFNPLTVQPVASRYTDYATRPTFVKVVFL